MGRKHIFLLILFLTSSVTAFSAENFKIDDFQAKSNGLVNIYAQNSSANYKDPEKYIQMQKQELKLEAMAMKKKQKLIKQEQKLLAGQKKKMKNMQTSSNEKSPLTDVNSKKNEAIDLFKGSTKAKTVSVENIKNYAVLQQKYNVPSHVIKQQRQMTAQMAEYAAQTSQSQQSGASSGQMGQLGQIGQMQNKGRSIEQIPLTKQDYKRMGRPSPMPSSASKYMQNHGGYSQK